MTGARVHQAAVTPSLIGLSSSAEADVPLKTPSTTTQGTPQGGPKWGLCISKLPSVSSQPFIQEEEVHWRSAEAE